MTDLRQNTFFRSFLKVFPLLLLFISVFNEFDANYFGVPFLSFNFAYILIFFCTLKAIDHFGYGLIFIAGLINDTVTGLPLGLSSFCYMIICVFSSYFRSITLRPTIMKDWLFFLITISVANSINYLVLYLYFGVLIDYRFLLVNNFTTFLLFFFFHFIFGFYYKKFIGKSDV
ncbi:rod shape-determining protein MreD [Candidatus Pelagibacter sp.]|uniref:rod shape-determining protein MreD n=1 Tax=Candidatus Pelagibacter sp. TaxID=2024849 RepID=UPI003F88024A